MKAAKNKLVDMILKSVESHRRDISEFTEALIAIPTENPPGKSYQNCIRLIERKLKELGLDCEVSLIPRSEFINNGSSDTGIEANPRYYILSYHGDGKKTLYFHGHYDVVPASGECQFHPYIENGRLYGRGSSDMKSGLAAMIYAMRAVAETGAGIDGRIGLLIVPDEETGGALGSRYLVNKGILGQNGIGMFTAEPTNGVIWNANRGVISMKVNVKGKSAHVGLHYQGVNAFEKMLVVANALSEVKAEVCLRKTGFRIEPEEARNSIMMIGGRCEGGTSFNSVPAECSFTVDRRINPEEDLETEKQRLLVLFEKMRQNRIELDVEVIQECSSAGIPEADPITQTLAESVESITGILPSLAMCPGVLETRFYAQKGIPALGYGPGLLSVSHGPDEYVKLEDIFDCTAAYALAAVRLLGYKKSF